MISVDCEQRRWREGGERLMTLERESRFLRDEAAKWPISIVFTILWCTISESGCVIRVYNAHRMRSGNRCLFTSRVFYLPPELDVTVCVVGSGGLSMIS